MNKIFIMKNLKCFHKMEQYPHKIRLAFILPFLKFGLETLTINIFHNQICCPFFLKKTYNPYNTFMPKTGNATTLRDKLFKVLIIQFFFTRILDNDIHVTVSRSSKNNREKFLNGDFHI